LWPSGRIPPSRFASKYEAVTAFEPCVRCLPAHGSR